MHTAGLVQQGQPNTDLQLFVPATQAVSLNTGTGVSTPVAAFAGVSAVGTSNQAIIDTIAVAASTTANLKFNLTELFIRTGMLKSTALASLSDQAFGTSNGPGPNSIAGTSDPSGFGYGEVFNVNTDVITTGSNEKTPVPSALLPTLVGPMVNSATVLANTKGIRIKWIDTIYQIHGVAATLVSTALFNYVLGSGHDVAVLDNPLVMIPAVLPSAALAINSTIHTMHRERQTVTDINGNPTTGFLVSDGSLVFAVAEIETPAGSTANLLGIIVGCDYNFN